MKSFLQGISGEMETTGSYGNVVGNRSATGVTTIANELKARPNMEAAILEETGFRDEIQMLLTLGAKHVNENVFINTPATATTTPWTEVSHYDICDRFTVHMHGSKWQFDQNQRYQKLLGMYPFWNQNPGVDQYQLNVQANEVADVLSDPDKVFIPPAPQPTEDLTVRPNMNALPAGPGGPASALDPRQGENQRQNRQTVEPGTGRAVRAF